MAWYTFPALYMWLNLTTQSPVPSDEEIEFALEFLDRIVKPTVWKLEKLLEKPKSTWNSVWRNDFCRCVWILKLPLRLTIIALTGSYLHAVRSAWNGLPTIVLEGHKDVVNPCIIEDCELPDLLAVPLTVEAGYTLTDPNDVRYQAVMVHRRQFGSVLHQASVALRESGAEDHIDALLAISRAIDVYLLEYGVTANAFGTLNKSYVVVREYVFFASWKCLLTNLPFNSLQRLWSKSKLFSRLVLMKRAQLYHSTRVYLNAMFRRRDALDDDLLCDLVELSLSPYTRVRRYVNFVSLQMTSNFMITTGLANLC